LSYWAFWSKHMLLPKPEFHHMTIRLSYDCYVNTCKTCKTSDGVTQATSIVVGRRMFARLSLRFCTHQGPEWQTVDRHDTSPNNMSSIRGWFSGEAQKTVSRSNTPSCTPSKQRHACSLCQKACCMQQRSPGPGFGAAVKDAWFALHWRVEMNVPTHRLMVNDTSRVDLSSMWLEHAVRGMAY
jgi:hypothetical protein